MDWKTMLSYISGSVDEDLLLRNEYLVAENQVLRNQFQGCLRLTDSERRSLAEPGSRLGKHAFDEIASTELSRQGESAAVPSQRPVTSVRAQRCAPMNGLAWVATFLP